MFIVSKNGEIAINENQISTIMTGNGRESTSAVFVRVNGCGDRGFPMGAYESRAEAVQAIAYVMRYLTNRQGSVQFPNSTQLQAAAVGSMNHREQHASNGEKIKRTGGS